MTKPQELLLTEFDYDLPPALIAQKPINPRDKSRLLSINRQTGEIAHQRFYQILNYLRPGDLLVLNNSKVFPARLIGHKETGGRVEIFLLRQKEANWECLLRGQVSVGQIIKLDQSCQARLVAKNQAGTYLLNFNLHPEKFWATIEKIGEVPLPPYIKRTKQRASDKKRYQTVFASDQQVGSVAAPTAGLHFTKRLLKQIKSQGVDLAYLTLHVGLGTFAPVKTPRITDFKIHQEYLQLSQETIAQILETKRRGGRVIAVGTTACRALESLNWQKLAQESQLSDQAQWTNIFIYPGYQFKIVDALITNFHLPQSSLLMLVSAYLGLETTKKVYQLAIENEYRFFSYGDAMFIY
ncbi:MAG: tRNA preQ1(34) S-adenosylmethionine ribosyltransferase-isomerase QueA [Patescibacteria group bacterium]|jgi:S-adenosylmethionine:tRNA ribosyltransferase-isomerase